MSELSRFIGGAGGVKLWTSGLSVKKWETVKSPLDGELYTRKTATGSGTTDPADDITNYFAASFERCGAMLAKPTASFLNNGGTASNLSYAYGIPRVQPGVVAINTRTLIYSQTGRGALTFLGLYASAARTLRVEVIIDGRSVHDASYSSTSINQVRTLLGNVVSGAVPGGSGVSQEGFGYQDSLGPLFRRSLQIYVTPTTGNIAADDAFAIATRSEA